MTNRIPLIVNSGASQIQEVSASDVLAVPGTLTANVIQTDNFQYANGQPFSGGGGGGTPGAPVNSIQFNNAGAFAGSANLVYISGSATLSLTGTVSATTLSATANVSGGNIRTLGQVSATGNITGNVFIGNGALLTGINANANYSNANVASYLPTYSGNVTAGNVSASGYVYGNGAFLTGITGGSGTYANANVASYLSSGTVSTNILTTAQISATANIAGGNIRTAGLVTATGNITTSQYFIGNGSQLTGLPATYANANVASYLASGTVTTDILTTTNISAAGYVYGNGSQLTGLGSSYSNSNVASYLSSGTVTTNIGTTATVSATNVTATSTVSGATVSASGTVTGATISTAGAVKGATVSATGQVTGNNVVALGQVSAVGNVTAANFIGNGAQLTGIPNGQVLITSNITSLTAGQALNIESIYGNAQYPGGIFNFYQSAAPRPTITMTNTWSSTGTTSKNAYSNYAGNVVNSSSVLLTLGISSPATFAIQASDDITIGNTVITGSNITGLGITGTGGTYTISSTLIGNVTEIAASSTVSANLSTSAGNGIGATGTTLTTIAPVPFSLSNIAASFANTSITPGLGNSQPMHFNVTAGTGTILSGNIIISGAANLTTPVGTSLVGNTANINSTAGNFVVTASYLGTGSFGAGNSVATVSANVAKVIETTPLFIKTTPTGDNPNFVPTDFNFGGNWVPAPGLPGNAQGVTTNQYNPDTEFYWLAIPDADFWTYTPYNEDGSPNLFYNYALTGIGIVNGSFGAAYGNGTDTFGGSGGVLNIGSVPYVALGFTGFANAQTGPSNPANVFIYVSTSSTS